MYIYIYVHTYISIKQQAPRIPKLSSPRMCCQIYWTEVSLIKCPVMTSVTSSHQSKRAIQTMMIFLT